MSDNKGSLVCVGTGMRLGGQLTPIAKSHIENADIVMAAVANHLTITLVKNMSKAFVCLSDFYGEGGGKGKSRKTTYQQMVDKILEAVRAGKKVCAVFYGHPGVFAGISHKAIAIAKKENYPTQMLPGISAEDCLVADLGIDPGTTGMQSMEATQFLIYQRNIDPTALFIMWQIGVVGDLTLKRFDTCKEHLELMVEKLARIYSLDQEVIIYEAATNPIEKVRIDRIALKDLSSTPLKSISTLVIPAAAKLEKDEAFLLKLEALAESGSYTA
ncbi:MAG: SAM-dependent methyltransferase, partial [Psychrosphaera sp.]|nr:SAM-dependent methyltransferase [Psychrosphaera sp.]